MPNQQIRRQWCGSCGEYRLFPVRKETLQIGEHSVQTEQECCEDCGNGYVAVPLENIPVEKREAQRERFKRARAQKAWGLIVGGMGRLSNPASSEHGAGDAEIQECDPGPTREEIRKEEQRAFVNKVAAWSVVTGRNDQCPCGSGKKFKKCCVVSARG